MDSTFGTVHTYSRNRAIVVRCQLKFYNSTLITIAGKYQEKMIFLLHFIFYLPNSFFRGYLYYVNKNRKHFYFGCPHTYYSVNLTVCCVLEEHQFFYDNSMLLGSPISRLVFKEIQKGHHQK